MKLSAESQARYERREWAVANLTVTGFTPPPGLMPYWRTYGCKTKDET